VPVRQTHLGELRRLIGRKWCGRMYVHKRRLSLSGWSPDAIHKPCRE